MPRLKIERLTREAFAPFGDIIEPGNAVRAYPINNGTTQRYHEVAQVDALDAALDPQRDPGAHVGVSIFRAQPREYPFRVEIMERHPYGSQAFVPIANEHGLAPFLVLVGPASPESSEVRWSGGGPRLTSRAIRF